MKIFKADGKIVKDIHSEGTTVIMGPARDFGATCSRMLFADGALIFQDFIHTIDIIASSNDHDESLHQRSLPTLSCGASGKDLSCQSVYASS